MADMCRTRHDARFRLIMAALALTAAAGAKAEITPLPLGSVQPAEIKIVSTEFKFNPAKFWVVAGREVTLVLDNSGAETDHGIFIPAFRFHLAAQAGTIAQKTAVFDKPGEYDFLCDLPGHSEAGMKGKLIVERF